MRNAREAELGTRPNVRDTCGLSRYSPEYSIYASYADQELFCRWKQDGVMGDVSKDWAWGGTQYVKDEIED